MRWFFAKYVGCGNDFILFDNRQGAFPHSQPELIQRLCHRQKGIGADGVILLESSARADFCMRIFNSDGSEAEMCGNGLRCFVKWLADMGVQRETYRIEVMHRVLHAFHRENAVCIEMGSPTHVQWNISLLYENHSLDLHHLDTGVPHCVLLNENIDAIKLVKLGPYIRYHPLWMSKGTNVTLAQQVGPQTLKIRTYERGIEGETLACGTGATAAALVAAHYYHLESPIKILTLSGETLKVEFLIQEQSFSQVKLSGAAHCLFQGEVDFINR